VTRLLTELNQLRELDGFKEGVSLPSGKSLCIAMFRVEFSAIYPFERWHFASRMVHEFARQDS
jgi:hypothetical protein